MPELAAAHLLAAHPQQLDRAAEQATLKQAEDGGQQLAPRQIARDTKHDEGGRLRGSVPPHHVAERIVT
ncbi:hypothetical protein [Deinococcus radiophilus]|uniref:hypothetical protein n=1 Tax=Deinococcus radiophilus TaxID=32062 RepID=UPI0036167D40